MKLAAKICRQLGLNHESPELFYSPQYKMPMIAYVVFRLCLFTYALAIITADMIYKSGRTPFVYITNWAYIVQVINYFVKAVIALDRAFLYGCRRYDQPNLYGKDETMCWYLKLEWLLHNVAAAVPYQIVISYWLQTLSAPFTNPNYYDPQYLHFTIQMHGVSLFLAILDQVLGATPTRLAHVYQPLLFYAIFSAFSGIMYAATDHGPIYPDLNWDDPRGAIIFVLIYFGEGTASHLWVWIVKTLQTKSGCGCVMKPPIRQYHHRHHVADSTTPLLISVSDDDVFT